MCAEFHPPPLLAFRTHAQEHTVSAIPGVTTACQSVARHWRCCNEAQQHASRGRPQAQGPERQRHATQEHLRCNTRERAHTHTQSFHTRAPPPMSPADLYPTMRLNDANGQCVQHIRYHRLLILHLGKGPSHRWISDPPAPASPYHPTTKCSSSLCERAADHARCIYPTGLVATLRAQFIHGRAVRQLRSHNAQLDTETLVTELTASRVFQMVCEALTIGQPNKSAESPPSLTYNFAS